MVESEKMQRKPRACCRWVIYNGLVHYYRFLSSHTNNIPNVQIDNENIPDTRVTDRKEA